jgi:hypothetical protein
MTAFAVILLTYFLLIYVAVHLQFSRALLIQDFLSTKAHGSEIPKLNY